MKVIRFCRVRIVQIYKTIKKVKTSYQADCMRRVCNGLCLVAGLTALSAQIGHIMPQRKLKFVEDVYFS